MATSETDAGEANAGEVIVLRVEGGAWFALPPEAFEAARGGGGEAAPVVLPAEALAAYRLPDERAAELEAAAAADTAGFTIDAWYWEHSHAIGFVAVDGVLRPAYRVPLDLVAQRGLVLRTPGYGR